MLRKIKESRWLTEPPYLEAGYYDDPPWLEAGSLWADCLDDIASADGGRLSFYRIATQADIEIVGAALIAGARNFQTFEYALLDDSIPASLGLTIVETTGDTPDVKVNDLHVDVVELTTTDAVALANEIHRHHEARSRVPKPRIKKVFMERRAAGYYDEGKILVK